MSGATFVWATRKEKLRYPAYGLTAAARLFEGRDFRCPLIGRWLK